MILQCQIVRARYLDLARYKHGVVCFVFFVVNLFIKKKTCLCPCCGLLIASATAKVVHRDIFDY